MDQKTIILDITDCKDLNDLHKRIKSTFNFPDFYGENWDAFWDLLHTECSAKKLKIQGAHTLPEKLLPHLKILFGILKRNQKEAVQYGWQFDYEMID